MKKEIYFSFIMIASHVIMAAGENKYEFATISEELKKNANAVVRNQSVTYEIKSESQMVETVKYCVTILNEKGEDAAELKVYYDNDTKINYIKGQVYGMFGEPGKKLKTSEIRDFSTYDGFSIYSDNRIKYFGPEISAYPFTIEYEYQVTHRAIHGFPTWYPVEDYNISVEVTELKIITPETLPIKFYETNYPGTVTSSVVNTMNTYQWVMQNIKAGNWEGFSPPFGVYMPAVHLSPVNIYYDGYKGSAQTWEDYGKWTYSLINGRDNLPPATIEKVKQLTSGIGNKIDVIKKIYNYVQNNTRYVSVQVGIGGYQPIEASKVDQMGYGDCKALSNYTRALLKVAGIEAYYTEIGNGDRMKNTLDNFASAYQTNHVILCVPLDNDTMWLECTSQKVPAGYIYESNCNRKALLVTPQGGKRVSTPYFSSDKNIESRIVNATLDGLGNIQGRVITDYKGFEYDHISHVLYASPKEQREYLLKRLKLNNFDIADYSYKETRDKVPATTETIDLTVRKYASQSGNRYFVPLNMLNKVSKPAGAGKERVAPLYLDYAYTEKDSIVYELPPNCTVEFLPESASISSPFGEYASRIEQKNGRIIYKRTLKMNSGQFAPGQYKEFCDFLEKCSRQDYSKAIIISSASEPKPSAPPAKAGP